MEQRRDGRKRLKGRIRWIKGDWIFKLLDGPSSEMGHHGHRQWPHTHAWSHWSYTAVFPLFFSTVAFLLECIRLNEINNLHLSTPLSLSLSLIHLSVCIGLCLAACLPNLSVFAPLPSYFSINLVRLTVGCLWFIVHEPQIASIMQIRIKYIRWGNNTRK